MSGRRVIVRLTYPESDWGDDFAEFISLNDLTNVDVHRALQSQSEALSVSDFPSVQDYADAVCEGAAGALDAVWHYVFPVITFEVSE
mgnify:FL=1